MLKPTHEQLMDVTDRACKLKTKNRDWSWQDAHVQAIIDYREEHPNWREESDEKS